MKKINNKIGLALAILFMLVTSFTSAQMVDKLIFLNGITKEGKVLLFSNETIQFIHQGESLKYEFSKKEIEKIEYASGRSEWINEKKVTDLSFSHADSRNKVAVMPMAYIGDDNESRSEAMRFHLQNIAISFLSKSAAELQFMDATEINAILLKNGINETTVRRYTPKELAELLQVEYLVMGDVLQDKGSLVTHNNSRSTRKQKSDHGRGWGGTVSRNNTYGTSVATQMMETQVTLSIYNETGQRIYARSRHSLLSEQDAYKNTIHYLLKRTPLYKR